MRGKSTTNHETSICSKYSESGKKVLHLDVHGSLDTNPWRHSHYQMRSGEGAVGREKLRLIAGYSDIYRCEINNLMREVGGFSHSYMQYTPLLPPALLGLLRLHNPL